ncbi:MAG: enoyl-CoA hydratase [Flavobacteriales bacterium]|jgi:enoyl-CoA hydratase
MSYKNILQETQEGLMVLTINRPEKLNALNKETIGELSNAFKAAEADKAVKAVILTGSGTKSFVAGADISEFAHFDENQGKALAADGQKALFDLIENLKTPVIAAVNGFALGGGLELAMSCHIRLASDNAKMGLPETSLGVIPGYGGTQRLTALVGKGKAMELIMTAGMLTADEALSLGLVNAVYPQEELLAATQKLAGKIMRNSSMAIAEAIGAINAYDADGTDGYQAEIDAFGRCFATADFKEGTTAFLEKRRPSFPGA